MSRTTNINNKPPLGTIISLRLKDMDRTQKWLANDVGTDNVYINRIIVGRSTPSLQMLRRIAKSLNIDVKELANALLCEG